MPAVVDLRESTEDAFALIAPSASAECLDEPGLFAIRPRIAHPLFNFATRLRLEEDEVEPTVARMRAWFGERDRPSFSWIVGSSARPSDLVERLLRLGAHAEEDDPVSAALVLVSEPPRVPAAEVRPVQTYEEYLESVEVQARAFGLGDSWLEDAHVQARERWDELRERDDIHRFVAYLDGRPAAFGNLVFLRNGLPYLVGGGTLPEARGRGLYRALVRARWEEAARRGQHVLLLQAGKMSRPIAERLGFRKVGEVHVLLQDST